MADTPVVTPEDILASAKKLLGSPYRVWQAADPIDPDPIPMWLMDGDYGTTSDTLPPPEHFRLDGDGYGIECSDLINYALNDNNLPGIEGTENAINHLEDQQPFDLATPGKPGYVAYLPYTAPQVGYQGHIALYWDEYYLIQALEGYGVTWSLTDNQTYWLSPDCKFSIYAKLPGVTYPD